MFLGRSDRYGHWQTRTLSHGGYRAYQASRLFVFFGYSLKLTAILPLKIGKIPKGITYSNYPFLGAMLVSSHKSQVNPINPKGIPKETICRGENVSFREGVLV